MMNHKCFKTKIIWSRPLIHNTITFSGAAFVYYAATEFDIVLKAPIPFLNTDNNTSNNIQTLSIANVQQKIIQCLIDDKVHLKSEQQLLRLKYEKLKYKYHTLKREQQATLTCWFVFLWSVFCDMYVYLYVVCAGY